MQTERSSFLILNSDCRRIIFNQLNIEDLMNLAESCSSLREINDELFGKYSTFELNGGIIQTGVTYIKRIIRHIHPFVVSLNINSESGKESKLKLTKIINDCKNLQSLKILIWTYNGPGYVPASYSFDNVEMLRFNSCSLYFASTFLAKFHKLKLLHMSYCYISDEDLKTVFQKNPNIESFIHDHLFDLQLLELNANIERLCITVSDKRFLNFDSLLTLNRLKRLAIHSLNINISDLLRDLAKKGIMEEMDIRLSTIDDNIFDILKSFDKLSTLVITSNRFRKEHDKWTLKSVVWPTKLKCLQLQNFYLTHKVFMSTLKQLKNLENIDLRTCFIANSDQQHFNNSKTLFQQIVDVIGISDNKQRLDLVLPCRLRFLELSSERYLFDSERLRILAQRLFSWPENENIASPLFSSFISD